MIMSGFGVVIRYTVSVLIIWPTILEMTTHWKATVQSWGVHASILDLKGCVGSKMDSYLNRIEIKD